jgi:hypothetical protein
VIWNLVLQPDSEGPTLISHAAGAISPVLRFSGKIVDLPPITGLSDDDKRKGILKMRRFLGELGVTKPALRTKRIASMDHAIVTATLLATPFATSLLPLTLRLLPVIAQIARLIADFRAAELTPSASHHFEIQLQANLRELGRIILDWAYNHLEPDDRLLMPDHLRFDGHWYRRRAKTANRSVATLFGTITLWRYLYQPIHGVERSIFPLEIRLGLAAGHATPALAERVAHAAVDSTQGTVLAGLRGDHAVAWSVATLRAVIAVMAEGMAPQFHDAQVARVLAWLEQARASHGSCEPVLAAGRDGVFVPIRGDDSYREAATATLSVHDRAGVRLGTVYLGRMPEPGQVRLSEQLTRLITDVLSRWSGPLPRLAYITDAGHHPTDYYERVLKPMEHPCRSGERLKWEWVIDFYHASRYVYDLSEALFRDGRQAQSWARKMCRWLKSKPRAVYRILHSAAAIRSRRTVLGRSQAYGKAYGYLRDHIAQLDYTEYRRQNLPIGSGVTEAACKTVFTQRLKRSGMAWSEEGGQRIVDLRVIHLSGVWTRVHQSYLQLQMLPEDGTQEGKAKEKSRKAA